MSAASWVKPARGPLLVLALHAVADALFTFVAGHGGLLAPFGAVHPGPLLLGFFVLLLRLTTLFVVLPWTAFLLAPRLAAKLRPAAARTPVVPATFRTPG